MCRLPRHQVEPCARSRPPCVASLTAMPLKVVPAGDERCDVHNERARQKYVCETCLKKFGIDPEQSEAAEPERERRGDALRAVAPDGVVQLAAPCRSSTGGGGSRSESG